MVNTPSVSAYRDMFLQADSHEELVSHYETVVGLVSQYAVMLLQTAERIENGECLCDDAVLSWFEAYERLSLLLPELRAALGVTGGFSLRETVQFQACRLELGKLAGDPADAFRHCKAMLASPLTASGDVTSYELGRFLQSWEVFL